MSALLALLAVAGLAHAGGTKPPGAIWRSACAYCHELSKVAPPIPKGIDADAIKPFVRNGSGAMPPFHRSEITDAELNALAEWLKAGRQGEVRRR